jgi:phage terminase large subunit
MQKVEIHTEIFNDAYIPFLTDMTPMQILFGGSSSGKSVFAVGQRPIYDVMNGGRNYLVCRQVARTIRNSVFNEIIKVINSWGVGNLFNINKTDMVITCSNGYQILFVGLDDVEKLKSITPAKGVITDVVVEEATETELGSLKQLEKRLRGGSESYPKRLTLLFNPILQSHYIYSEYFATIAWADQQKEYHSDEISILKTTYLDNKRFLTSQDVKRLENEKDTYYYDVYTLGNWGILGDVIFKNWKVLDLSEMMNQFTNHRAGLDFGFSSDPAAMPVMHYDKKKSDLYIYDEIYERGLTNQDLALEIIKHIGNKPVTCDSAEPKSIQELKEKGVKALAAIKGKDSVNFGIQWLQGLNSIIIDSKCVNSKNEFSTYHWKKDKDGNTLRIPVDKNNHIIDGARYAMEDDMIESKTSINPTASVGNYARGLPTDARKDIDKPW